MNRVPRQNRGKALVIEHGDRCFTLMLDRARPGDQNGRLLLLAGKDDQTAPTPFGVAQSRRYGVPAVEPNPGAGRLAAGSRHTYLLLRCETLAPIACGFRTGLVSTYPD